jgi:hypothetical protein
MHQKAAICISYPKSGRTLLRVALAQLGIKIEYAHAGSGHGRDSYGVPPERMILRDPFDAHERIVFLYRNPLDTVVSFYHHTMHRVAIPPGRRIRYLLEGKVPKKDLDRFIRQPGFGIERIVLYNLHYLEKYAGRRDFMPVSYEEMIAERGPVLRRIGKFVAGIEVDDAALARTVAETDFKTMQQRERNGHYAREFGKFFGARENGAAMAYKVRRGKVGGYADEMSSSSIEYCASTLEKHGYEQRVRDALHRLASPLPIAAAIEGSPRT